MNMDLNKLFKGLQSTVVSYQDIGAIFTKLFTQGHLEKLAALLHEVYDEEHVFTLTELQRYCKESGQKEDEFVAEQYELNASIFRRNLSLIVQNLVEEVGKNFLEKFKQDFSTGGSVKLQDAQEEEEEAEIPDQSYEKTQYKSNMPAIQEETEQSAGANHIPTTSTFRAKTTDHEQESENNTPSNKFDLNINDLNKRVQTQPPQQVSQSNQNSEQKNYNQQQRQLQYQQEQEYQQYQQQQQQYQQQLQYQQQQQQYQQQQQQYYQEQQPDHKQRSVQKNIEEQYRRAYNNEQEREEAYHNAMSSLRNDELNSVASDANRYEGFNQYDQDSMNYRANLQKYFKQPGQNNLQHFTPAQYSNNPHWSSPERGKAWANKNMTPTTSQRKQKATSPERMDTSTSYVNRSMSRWSTSNDRPDPSVLDSEFSYGSGKSFAKSPKKFHWDINKVPGPGHYELEESKKLVRSVTPDVIFPKSPKVPSYIKKNQTPGPIYYPIRHFSSK